MHAVRLEAVHDLVLREVPKPEPGPGELLVRVEAAGVCGSDRHFYHGDFPCSPPVTLGHEFCGTVEQVGAGIADIAVGARISADPNITCGHCAACRAGRVNLCENLTAIGLHRDGGFADYAVVPRNQAHLIPDGIAPTHGAFCEPLACCLHGVDIAGIDSSSSVVVLGGGVIGLLTVQLARLAGARTVILSTRQASRRRIAEEVGATHTVDPTNADVVAAIAGRDGIVPGGADVVIECAGVPDTMRQMTALARRGGTVVVLGVMPRGETVPIEPFDILFRELKVLGSFINPFTHARAAALIASGAVRIEPLITSRLPLEAVPDVIRSPAAPGEIKAMFVAA